MKRKRNKQRELPSPAVQTTDIEAASGGSNTWHTHWTEWSSWQRGGGEPTNPDWNAGFDAFGGDAFGGGDFFW